MTDKKELFETMPLNKAIVKLVIPNIIGSLVMILYNLADTYFVCLLNDPVQTSAVTLFVVLLFMFNAISNLFVCSCVINFIINYFFNAKSVFIIRTQNYFVICF